MSTRQPDTTDRLTRIYTHAVDALDALADEQTTPATVGALYAAHGGKAVAEGNPRSGWRLFRRAIQLTTDGSPPSTAEAYGVLKLSEDESHSSHALSDAPTCREVSGQYLVQDRTGLSAVFWVTASAEDPIQTERESWAQCEEEWLAAAKDRLRAEVINPARQADNITTIPLTGEWD